MGRRVITFEVQASNGESWIEAVVVKGDGPRKTIKLGQLIGIKAGCGCQHAEGRVETLLPRCSRPIVALFPNGDRANFTFDEVLPKREFPAGHRRDVEDLLTAQGKILMEEPQLL